MRIIPALLLALSLSAISCVAQEKLTLDESNSVKTYTPAQFMKEVAANPHEGTLVRIKFNGRTSSLSNGPDGTKVGYLRSRDPNYYYNGNTSGLEAQVPAAGLPWFQHVNLYSYDTYDRVTVKSYVVYARVKTDPSGTTCVRLVGTEVKHDLDGDTIVWN